MQIDFGQDMIQPAAHTGFLDKQASIRKNWKTRYFVISNGSMMYYSKGPADRDEMQGVDIRGTFSLLGADVCIVESIYLNLTLQGEKRAHIQLRAKTDKEASDWLNALTRHIRHQNIEALAQQCRLPEVVEWYYQLQADLNRKHSFLLKNTEVYLIFPSAKIEGENVVSIFNIAMTEDRSGLVLSIMSSGKKPTRNESLNNGRILLFGDLLGAHLPHGWNLSKQSRFNFTLITKEDSLALECDPMGVTWLQAVKDMVQFSRITPPTGRSLSVAPERGGGGFGYGNTNANISPLMEFSANSGAVFACSNDVQLILEGLHRVSYKSPIILDIGQRINVVLKLIPDMRCNKEAGMAFGERIEEITRVLGDSDVGVLFLSKETDKSLLNFHLSTLNGKLNDVIQYLSCHTKKGWLAFNVTSRAQDNAKMRFEQFDADLTNSVNTLIRGMHITQAVLFEKKEYAMAVDVKRSVEALGGIEAIYKEVAKERALAKLIQADGHEVHSELEDFLKNAFTSTNRISYTYDSYRVSVDSTNSAGGRRTWLQFLCGCFFSTESKPSVSGSSKKSVSMRPSKLQEPLVS